MRNHEISTVQFVGLPLPYYMPINAATYVRKANNVLFTCNVENHF